MYLIFFANVSNVPTKNPYCTLKIWKSRLHVVELVFLHRPFFFSSWDLFHLGVSKNRGGPPKWMVKIMENPIQMDDLGGTTIFGNIYFGQLIIFHQPADCVTSSATRDLWEVLTWKKQAWSIFDSQNGILVLGINIQLIVLAIQVICVFHQEAGRPFLGSARGFFLSAILQKEPYFKRIYRVYNHPSRSELPILNTLLAKPCHVPYIHAQCPSTMTT